MTLVRRLSAFVERNRGAVLSNVVRQALVRPWVRLKLWNSVGRFLPARQPERWVFMGGCYNSGTTVLREILGSHPEIASLPREGVDLTSVFPDLEAGGWQRMWHRNSDWADLEGDPRAMAYRAMRDWAPWWPRGKSVFLEKSIVHGAWMPTLQAGFGECRFIGVVRNGMCAAEGIRRRARPSGTAAATLGRDDYPIAEAAAQWVCSNARLARDRGKVDHYLEIRYEDLVADPSATLTRVFGFLGVRSDVFEHCGGGVIRVGRRQFTIRDDNPASLARLSADERRAFLSVAGPMMAELGYALEVTP